MRLLLTADTAGGVWDYAATLTRGMVAEGHTVLVAAVGDTTSGRLADLPPGVAVEARDERLEWAGATAGELTRTAEWIRDLADSWGADVVHLNQLVYTGLVRLPAPSVVAVHSDVVSWFAEVEGRSAPSELSAYRAGVTRGLRRADVRVAPSYYQSDLTARHYGVPVDRVIHNAARVPRAVPTTRSDFSLLTVGRAWDRAKGIAILDAALELLGEAAPAALLVGQLEGPRGERTEPRRLTSSGAVPRAQVEREMERATLYVAPSLYEPFGLAPLEAALHGCALLLSDIGSFRELWDGCAAFFEPGSAPALAAAIEQLAGSPETTARLAAAARERACSRFSVERFTEDHLELYRGVLAGGSSAPAPHPSAAGG
jgi:glycogen synthase